MPRPDGRRTAAQWRARGVQSSSQPARTPCARSARQGVTLEFAQRCQKEVTCRHNKRDGRAVARASCPPARRPLLPSFLAPSGMPALRGGNLACPPIGVEQGASLLPRARNVRRVRACHSTTAAMVRLCGRHEVLQKNFECVWAVYYKQIRQSEQRPPLHLRAADLVPQPRTPVCHMAIARNKLR